MKSAVIVVVSILGLLPVWSAEAVTAQLGDQDFMSGTFHTSGDFTTMSAGDPPIFNAPCGSDNNVAGPNCSLGWTLTYSIPAGETITGAALTLGIWDHDSAVAGDQVFAYTINSIDLTALLNMAFNSFGGADGPNCPGPNGGTVFCSEYDVYTINVPAASLTALAPGPAAVVLTLQGPGHAVLGNTTFNGAIIDFSRLDITTVPAETRVPEPATLMLVAAGLGGIGARAFVGRRKGA
ncbi:MAG TPA: PEP-CTERM sorting domain-containing protein [Vicinamibacterales bacterium]|jgi:hypothetical protein